MATEKGAVRTRSDATQPAGADVDGAKEYKIKAAVNIPGHLTPDGVRIEAGQDGTVIATPDQYKRLQKAGYFG